ncbi:MULTISPECIES: PEP-CTERM sorting domain-containing protein [unclassified Microcystis]|uniref:PEP-CTERM sorting domain-containing protein n=1 Tax=unclassified Microcystis TaxID=2643300 RepID=UPI002583A453|nr:MULTISPECIES: PEP-CTERM sorting domain-containing protein [unclassified Microcystis]MCA2761874.1 PEP-CTERM sorting domain-containing protein [Microcystis sp. M151S2]NCS50109.1 PEP-CTERM sorting domain-containing protein [Microcystis aeruginosa BK11-02]MCA2641364.1 PEP-CTERM sorting domain-containing protein [Microcystis sp. M087S2]MCA2670854.1 PEP-CTERM sorting domain-containing protein [Microcystis sp. M080S2]MCA2688784.1 PEP-CTERM sorting domain-containing protein [Microcystis sp. M037S2]
MKNWTLALALGAAATTTMIGFGVNPASAGTLTWNFSFDIDTNLLPPSNPDYTPSPTPVKGTFITENTLSTSSVTPGFTGYEVLSITGTQGIDPITGLVPQGTGSTSLLLSGFTNDNLFNPANIVPVGGVGAFSAGGLAYIEGGEEYRLLYDQGTYMGCLTPCVTVQNLDVKLVPEPSSTAGLLAIGSFGALGAASTLKRKLKSSKPSEKETTKVG